MTCPDRWATVRAQMDVVRTKAAALTTKSNRAQLDAVRTAIASEIAAQQDFEAACVLPPPAPTSNLLQPEHISYLGSFTLPGGFEYGGTAISVHQGSLFIVSGLSAAEVTIPGIGEPATIVQPLASLSEGAAVGTDVRIGGTLVVNGELWFTQYVYYDADGTQMLSHFRRPIDLSQTGQVQGPFRVGPLGAGFYSGYLAAVPASLQAVLGGPVLTGNCCLNIISRTSFGPAAFALDLPPSLGALSAYDLVYYPSDHPTLGPWNGVSEYFGGSDRITGLVVPDGFASVLFFGRHGTTFCYGGPECSDPTDPYQGVHGYPYESSVWAYRASDLADVRQGLRPPYEVFPYARWVLPELAGSLVNGAAYDPTTQRIYVSRHKGDGDNPRIHVYQVTP